MSNLYAINRKLSIVIDSNILYCIAFCLSPLIAQKCYLELPICGKHPARTIFFSQSVRFDIDELLTVKVAGGRPGGFDIVESHNEQWLRLEGLINTASMTISTAPMP